MGLLSSLFGGNSNSSQSSNRAFEQIQGAATPAMTAGLGGITALGNELSGGFDDYLDKSGFDFALGEGLRGVTRAGAAKGLLRSGSTSKALATYADGMKRRAYDNYLNAQSNLGQLGLGAGGLIAGAGQESESKGKGKNGILTSLFSDRNVKQDILLMAELAPGLNLYSFRYIGLDLPLQMGFMADEVERFCPEAIGEGWYAPLNRKVKTVNYDLVLEELRKGTFKEAA